MSSNAVSPRTRGTLPGPTGRVRPVRVLLVDDHPIFRAGLRAALQPRAEIDVVGEADSARSAVHQCGDLTPDVVLLDMSLPDGSGIDVARTLTTRTADSDRPPPPRVLVLSVSAEDDKVIAALRAGARGYFVKDSGLEDVVRGVLTVADGGGAFCPAVTGQLARYFASVHAMPCRVAFPDLSEREVEVLDLLARGQENHRIARELCLAEKTVRNHVTNIFAKLRVRNRSQAAIRARDAGLGA